MDLGTDRTLLKGPSIRRGWGETSRALRAVTERPMSAPGSGQCSHERVGAAGALLLPYRLGALRLLDQLLLALLQRRAQVLVWHVLDLVSGPLQLAVNVLRVEGQRQDLPASDRETKHTHLFLHPPTWDLPIGPAKAEGRCGVAQCVDLQKQLRPDRAVRFQVI